MGHETDGPVGPATTPRALFTDRVAVVVNGNAKRVTDDLVDILDQIVQSGDLFVSRSLEEGDEIARTIARRGYPTVLTAGGDGTFVQMVTKITDEAHRLDVPPPRFGLLRLGTGNALAWVLGAQNPKHRGVVADLGRLRTEGGSRQMRLLDVEGTLTPFAGLGIDAIALHDYNETKKRLAGNPLTRPISSGGAAYLVAVLGKTMPQYLVRPHPRVRIVNEGAPVTRLGRDGEPVQEIAEGETLYQGPMRMVAMSTIPYWGFGARIFPFADDRDDRFSLRVVDIHSLQVALHIRAIWNGTYRSDTLHDFLCERVAIHLDDPMPFQIGGDPVGLRETVRAAIADEPIEVVDYYAPPPV
ncbi:MAG TPA: diacylglycerol kinase family protein [Sandaracinaceae bacterium LLY-WYZ-13_1]|nr:diacylglycerol kinase family protein [Sandaracinaceae bacterium LLY-WYZ-13_1]